MPRLCSVCQHQQRHQIENAIAAGQSLRSAAKQFSVSPAAIHRHRRHSQSGSTEDHARTNVGRPEDRRSKDANGVDEPLVLLPREEALASLLAQGNISVAEACRRCGFNPSSSTIRNRLKPGGDIHRWVISRMRELGLTLDVALLKVREFLDAKKEVPNPAANNQGARLAAMIHGEKISPTLELRDNESQRWATEQTLKLHGAYPKPNDEENRPGGRQKVVAI